MQFNYSTPVKDCQSSSRHSKSQNQTRQGDWFCLNCNNVNFSFRKKCNRCKTQTRKQNQDLQNAYTLYFYNQQEANLYNYENHMYPQAISEPIYHVSEVKPQGERKGSFNEINEHSLGFSRNNQSQSQMIQVSVASPLRELTNQNYEQNCDNRNKKLRTPSSKKKRTQKKKNDLLPSVSPLLKKLLAKEDTNSKSHPSNSKDSLNVALFYDEIWDTNKENLPTTQSEFIQQKNHLYFTNSAKKLGNSRMHKTSDSTTMNPLQENGFAFFMRSPEKEEEGDEIIEIDEGDEELAQIISKIIV